MTAQHVFGLNGGAPGAGEGSSGLRFDTVQWQTAADQQSFIADKS